MVVKNLGKNLNQCFIGNVQDGIDIIREGSKTFDDASEVVSKLSPKIPTYLYRPHALKRAAKWFESCFTNFQSSNGENYSSKVLFSVKSNCDERVIRDVYEGGVRGFDVASINEVIKVDSLIGKRARIYFMHPIKPKEVISESYFKHGVKDFSFDSQEELDKMLLATHGAKDLSLHLRIMVENKSSAIDLSGKFGIDLERSLDLAIKARKVAKSFGVCFHVGSQCMDSMQFGAAIKRVADFFSKVDIKIDSFDVGGGFPSCYPGMRAESMTSYIEQIRSSLKLTSFPKDCDILCEPGRAISAGCESLLVRVEARKGSMLYINDGTYGGLFDAGIFGFSYFCEVYDRQGNKRSGKGVVDYSLYGPTCDSVDFMKGPFALPQDVEAGDYIEMHNFGSYSKSLRTSFNGYGDIMQIDVENEVDKKYCQLF